MPPNKALNNTTDRMGRQTCLILAGISLAFFMCAINFSLLAQRTVVPPPTPSAPVSSSSNILSLDLPWEEEGDGDTVVEDVQKGVDVGAVKSGTKEGELSPSCFRARKNTIPPSMYGNLSFPLINLGENFTVMIAAL